MIVKAVREGLGRIIIFLDFISRPTKMKRSEDDQKNGNTQASALSVYQFYACPFCVKTRRAIHRLNIPIEYRDAQNDPVHRKELETEGGRIKVPCLRIEEGDQSTWMYESKEIISYLNKRFDPSEA
ncbi:MAG: glutaredoxin [Candidatus Lindowbacteria bacterium]|nr:glutaredoxin [Candidatus Lindowbacteria bacterium]